MLIIETLTGNEESGIVDEAEAELFCLHCAKRVFFANFQPFKGHKHAIAHIHLRYSTGNPERSREQCAGSIPCRKCASDISWSHSSSPRGACETLLLSNVLGVSHKVANEN